jgi:Fur family transcriptional regulator, ferric uptake regulator
MEAVYNAALALNSPLSARTLGDHMQSDLAHGSSDPQTLARRLRALCVRVTPQRLLVLEALAAHGGHMTAEEVMRWAAPRSSGLNLATVYRTLELLVSLGMVAQTDLGGEATAFELVGRAPHHHLVCERCGAVIEMDDSLFQSLRSDVLRRYGFDARSRHIALFGLCRDCQSAAMAHDADAH